MKTTLYIDGFNLYYGVLKGSPYKWLDVVKLFTHICQEQNPDADIVAVKFFTAPVKGKIATRGEQAVLSQNAYHKALRTLYPDLFQVIEGYFILEAGGMPRYQNPLVKTDRVNVWRLEEKKTDVNIAVHLYRDAYKGMGQLVLVSNDSDIVPALEAIQEDFQQAITAAIMPRLKPTGGEARPPNAELSKLSNWTRHYILEEELKACQLPNMIPTKKRAVYKPDYW